MVITSPHLPMALLCRSRSTSLHPCAAELLLHLAQYIAGHQQSDTTQPTIICLPSAKGACTFVAISRRPPSLPVPISPNTSQ